MSLCDLGLMVFGLWSFSFIFVSRSPPTIVDDRFGQFLERSDRRAVAGRPLDDANRQSKV